MRVFGLPATILRATQFHKFAGQTLERMRFGPLVTIPALLARPVSAREVADVLADLLVEEPVTAVSSTPLEMAGPETLTLIEMVRKLQQRVGDRHLAVSVSLPGLAGRTMRHGGLIPRGPSFRQGTVTFTDWLDALPTLSHPHGQLSSRKVVTNNSVLGVSHVVGDRFRDGADPVIFAIRGGD